MVGRVGLSLLLAMVMTSCGDVAEDIKGLFNGNYQGRIRVDDDDMRDYDEDYDDDDLRTFSLDEVLLDREGAEMYKRVRLRKEGKEDGRYRTSLRAKHFSLADYYDELKSNTVYRLTIRDDDEVEYRYYETGDLDQGRQRDHRREYEQGWHKGENHREDDDWWQKDLTVTVTVGGQKIQKGWQKDQPQVSEGPIVIQFEGDNIPRSFEYEVTRIDLPDDEYERDYTGKPDDKGRFEILLDKWPVGVYELEIDEVGRDESFFFEKI